MRFLSELSMNKKGVLLMENYFTDIENAICSFLLKSFLILGCIFVISISALMIRDAITFNNSFYKSITFISSVAISTISILSSTYLYKKIK